MLCSSYERHFVREPIYTVAVRVNNWLGFSTEHNHFKLCQPLTSLKINKKLKESKTERQVTKTDKTGFVTQQWF